MTIWERVSDALESLNVPFAADKLVVESGVDLPDLYMVFFLISSPPEQHADNKEIMRSYQVQVNVFCRSGLVNLPDVDGVMKAAGFLKGNMIGIPKEEDNGHFGLGTEYEYSESEE